MLSDAITKLKLEMEQNNNNPYIQVVGNFLTEYVSAHPDTTEKILVEGKSIGNSLNEMRKAAEKKKVGNSAVLTDQEGFDIVLKYFGIENSVQNCGISKPAVEISKSGTHQVDLDAGLDFDINDIL